MEQDFLTDEWMRMLDLCADVRADLRERGIVLDPDTWSAALDEPLRRMVVEDRMGQAKGRLLKNLGVGVKAAPPAKAKA
jgi:hypothetical protein